MVDRPAHSHRSGTLGLPPASEQATRGDPREQQPAGGQEDEAAVAVLDPTRQAPWLGAVAICHLTYDFAEPPARFCLPNDIAHP